MKNGEQNMYKYIFLVVALIVLSFWYTGSENLKAMKACQINHSYDTCAWNILR